VGGRCQPLLTADFRYCRIDEIKVLDLAVEEKPAAGDTETPTDGPKGSDEAEAEAEQNWAKAEAAEKDGNKVKARIYYKKVVDAGETSYLARAKAKLEELGE